MGTKSECLQYGVEEKKQIGGGGGESMDLSSWFRRSLSRNSKKTQNPDLQSKELSFEPEEEVLGITEKLIEYVKSFTVDTFKNFNLQDNEGIANGDDSPTTSGNVRKDLSEWQERHASLVLSKVKEISHLRYMLCPRHLKEHQFWGIYFKLVKDYVAEYELQAIRVAKLKRMAMENEKYSESSPCEVEMSETKPAKCLAPPSP